MVLEWRPLCGGLEGFSMMLHVSGVRLHSGLVGPWLIMADGLLDGGFVDGFRVERPKWIGSWLPKGFPFVVARNGGLAMVDLRWKVSMQRRSCVPSVPFVGLDQVHMVI